MPDKEWSADDRLLKSEHGPHEPSAIHRMYKHGWPGTIICKALKEKATAVVLDIQRSEKLERAAMQAGRPIHDALIPKEKT